MLLQRSASLSSSHQLQDDSISRASELAQSAQTVLKQFPEADADAAKGATEEKAAGKKAGKKAEDKPEGKAKEQKDPEQKKGDADEKGVAGETVEDKSAPEELQPNEAKNATKTGKGAVDADREMRPRAGSAEPEVVQFGMYIKQMHSINLVAETFSCDLVLTIRWLDQRAKNILQPGQDSLTLPTKRAGSHIWLPDIVVTNRKGFDVISSMVTVTDSGVVMKTERMLVNVLAAFDISAFPFDTQMLTVRLASASYMTNELQLSVLENPNFTGLPEDTFKKSGFTFNSVKAQTFEESDASLKKSRGSLDISITRDSRPIFATAIIPEILLLLISWSVFFFPMLPPFVMPRVATSLISLLSAMTLAVRTSTLLPPKRSSYVWIEFFQESCQVLMFFTVSLNILVEVIYHEWKFTDLASKMTNELQKAYIGMIFVVFALCYWGYLMRDTVDGLTPVVSMTRAVLFVSLVCYLAFGISRVRKAGCPVDA